MFFFSKIIIIFFLENRLLQSFKISHRDHSKSTILISFLVVRKNSSKITLLLMYATVFFWLSFSSSRRRPPRLLRRIKRGFFDFSYGKNDCASFERRTRLVVCSSTSRHIKREQKNFVISAANDNNISYQLL